MVAFLDISKAFDSAWWPSIFDTLKHSECPPRLLSAIHNFFADRQVLLNFAGVAVSKWLTLGCPQGSILSPLLWNIFFNSVFDLPRHRFITTIAYADDLTIIAPHFNASLSTMILNDFLSKLHIWSQSKKISFSANKSAVMVLRGPISWYPLIYLNGICLPVVSEFKFLGFIIARNFHFQKHINYVLRKGEARSHMLFRLLKSNKLLTFSNMLAIYKSAIIPSVTYGISFWFKTAMVSTYSKKFISMQRKCLLSMTGCLRTSSSYSVNIVAGVLPIMIYFDTLQARENLRISGSSQFGDFNFLIENGIIQGTGPDHTTTQLTYPDFLNFLKDRAIERWNLLWTSSTVGRFTFKFFPSVVSRLTCLWFCPRGPLARFLSGHSICADYLSRFNIATVEFCACESTPGDLLHDLYSCHQFLHLNRVFIGQAPPSLISKQFYSVFLEFSRLREFKRLTQLNNPR